MSSTPEAAQPGNHDLKRVLRLGDLVLFNVVAVLGLRWVATSAKAGPSSLVLWLLAALLFFIPQGLAVITLASRFPDEGGVYAWTRRTYASLSWSWVSRIRVVPFLSGCMYGTGHAGPAGRPLPELRAPCDTYRCTGSALPISRVPP